MIKENLFENAKRVFSEKFKFLQNDPKILILDQETHNLISILFTEQELKSDNFIEFRHINNLKYDVNYTNELKIIYILNSTQENINLLKIKLSVEHKSKMLNDCYIYFTQYNSVEFIKATSILCYKNVKIIDEFNINYHIVHNNAFHFNIENLNLEFSEKKIIVDNLYNLLLNLSFVPDVICNNKSKLCSDIHELLTNKISSQKNMLFSNEGKNLLVILDRKNDPITPIITSWIYLPLIHNIFDIKNNKIFENTIININSDKFLNDNCFKDYGALCDNLKCFISEYIDDTNIIKNLNNNKDIAKLKGKLIQNNNLKKFVNKHNNIVKLINDHANNNKLYDISELEQEIITNCMVDHNNIIQRMSDIIVCNKIDDYYKLKIIIIYLFRTKKSIIDNVSLLELLFNNITNKGLLNAIELFMDYINDEVNKPSIKSIMTHIISKIKLNVNNVNKLMQFNPEINDILSNLSKNKFKYNEKISFNVKEYKNIIIYFVGGVTYDEIKIIEEYNLKYNYKYFIGGDCILNNKKFIDLIDKSFGSNNCNK